MIKRKANTSFKNVRQGDLAPLAMNIVNTMKANVDIYAKPVPSLDEITKLINAYTTVLGKEEYAGQTGDIKAARMALEAALKLLGQYVNAIADGDEAKLERSGFPLSKVPSSHGEIPAPTEIGVGYTPSGEFELWATVVDKSYSGVLFAATQVDNPVDDPQQWAFQYSPTPEIVFTRGIVSGKRYKFAVAFVGSSEKLNWALIGRTLAAN